jgi:branched-chain amino acid aminotransferase
VNSIVASQEARTNGYDEALLLDMNGSVAEAPGANVFIEKNGCLFTPPAGHILSGITRATVLELAADLAIPVQEKYFTIEEMYDADAAFFCGTAVEVIGLDSLDDHSFSSIWENSKSHQIQKAYKQLVTQPAT